MDFHARSSSRAKCLNAACYLTYSTLADAPYLAAARQIGVSLLIRPLKKTPDVSCVVFEQSTDPALATTPAGGFSGRTHGSAT